MPGASEVMCDGWPKIVAFDLPWEPWGELEKGGSQSSTHHSFTNNEVISCVKGNFLSGYIIVTFNKT